MPGAAMLIASLWASHPETTLGSFQGTHQAGSSVRGGPWAGLGMPRLSQAWDFPGDLLRYPMLSFWGPSIAWHKAGHSVGAQEVGC